jgi:hypothetical protein
MTHAALFTGSSGLDHVPPLLTELAEALDQKSPQLRVLLPESVAKLEDSELALAHRLDRCLDRVMVEKCHVPITSRGVRPIYCTDGRIFA